MVYTENRMFGIRKKYEQLLPASMFANKLLIKALVFGSLILILALLVPAKGHAASHRGDFIGTSDRQVSLEQTVNTSIYSQSPSRSQENTENRQLVAQAFQSGLQAYEHGNYRVAERHWRQLAQQGHMAAQFNLGLMFHHGTGVGKNPKEAVDWYRRAAEQGHTNAQYSMGYSFAMGMGFATDMEQAVEWWQRAAGNGSVEAQYSLGLVYAQGLGIEQNSVQAVKWWQHAANQGNAAAQFNLGVMYANGEGVTKDLHEAEGWWKKSAAQGYDHAELALQTLILTNKLKSIRIE